MILLKVPEPGQYDFASNVKLNKYAQVLLKKTKNLLFIR